MSKTLGNVVDPVDIINEYGADAFRYYLARHIPSHDDGDFSMDKFEAAYNGELANELGNAVQRVAAMAMKYMDGVVGDVPDGEHDQGPYHEAMADCRFDKAIEVTKPWVIAGQGDLSHLKEVLAYSVSCLNEIAELLVPFLPDTAEKMTAMFKDGIIRMNDATLFPKKEK
jgi:methionyl-tRNA synthetase